MPPPSQVRDKLDQLLASARAGSHEALGQLFEECRHYLLLVANQERAADLQSKIGASDLVQETLLEAQRDFGRFQGGSEEELRGWLRRILLHNLANVGRQYRVSGKRSIGREVSLEDVPAVGLRNRCPPSDETPSDCAIAREQDEALQEALAQLPETARQVIQWRNYERCAFEEIGQRLGRSTEAARKLWTRALEQLQQLLDPPHGAP